MLVLLMDGNGKNGKWDKLLDVKAPFYCQVELTGLTANTHARRRDSEVHVFKS